MRELSPTFKKDKRKGTPMLPEAAGELYSFTGPDIVILLFGARKLVASALPLVFLQSVQ
jgi:hypothetical protein